MRVVADLLPKEANINVEASEAFVQSVEEDQRWPRRRTGRRPGCGAGTTRSCSSLMYSAQARSLGRQRPYKRRGVMTASRSGLVMASARRRSSVADPVVLAHPPELQGSCGGKFSGSAQRHDLARDRQVAPAATRCTQVDDRRAGRAHRCRPDQESAFAVRRTASKDNPEALQGFHAEHLLFLIDEASGIPDIVFEVGMGALSTPGAKVVMAGNPTRTSGFFYDTHHSLRGRWHTMHVNCLDVPTGSGAHRGHQGEVWSEQQCLSRARPRRVPHRGR